MNSFKQFLNRCGAQAVHHADLLGGAWMVAIAAWYFKYHTYYASGVTFAGTFLIVVGLWAVAAAVFVKRVRRINFLNAGLLFLFMTWLVGTFLYAVLDPAVLKEPYQLFFEGANIAAVEEGARVQGDIPPDFERGDIMTQWTDATQVLPAEIQAWFVKKSIGSFAFGLAKNLAMVVGFWLVALVFFAGLGSMAQRKRALEGIAFFEVVGVGMALTMAVVFVLGFWGQLTSLNLAVAAGILLIVGAPQWKMLRRWVRSLHLEKPKQAWSSWAVASMAGVGFFLSLNLLQLVHPFPSGYDSLTLYHNTPRLLLEYGALISGIPAYNIELLITLAVGLFKAPLFGMAMVVLGNLLAFALLQRTLAKALGNANSLLPLAVFVSLPMVNFMMNVDFKVDLFLLFFALLATHRALAWWKEKETANAPCHALWIGVWLGLAFGAKYTSLLLVASVFAFYAVALEGIGLALGIGLLTLVAVNQMVPLFFLEGQREAVRFGVDLGLGLVGVMLVGRVVLKRFKQGGKALWSASKPYVLTGGMVALLIAPWMVHNARHSTVFSASGLLFGYGAQQETSAELATLAGASCEDVSNYQEIDRYTGNFEGSKLLLPVVLIWESTVNSGSPNTLLADISFLFLGFSLLWLILRRSACEEHPTLRLIEGFTVFYGVLWLLTGRGLVWYGMPMLVGALLLCGKLMEGKNWTKWGVGVWLVLAAGLQVNFVMTSSEALLYAGGVTDETLYMEQMENGLSTLVATVNADEFMDQRVYIGGGSSSSYFVEQNDRRVVSSTQDPFLNEFMCHFKRDDAEETLERLRAFNISHLVFSTNNLGIEADPMGPLHQRFETFMGFAENHLVELFHTSDMTLYEVPES